MTDDVDTVTDAVALLRSEGYDLDVHLVDGQLRCGDCGGAHPAEDAQVERLYRFEGESDPGDEMLVAGLRCTHCGRRAVLASAFGPSADPGLAALAGRAGPTPESSG